MRSRSSRSGRGVHGLLAWIGYFGFAHEEASPVIAPRQMTPVAFRLRRIVRAASGGHQRAEERISCSPAVPLALKRLFCDVVRLPGDDCC